MRPAGTVGGFDVLVAKSTGTLPFAVIGETEI